jgi:hypothetical protein
MDPLRDLDGFAALLAELDLVISVDNSTVHLAGALNTPAWLLLPMVPNWRWLLDTCESHWYPSLRLLRNRSERDEWGQLLEVVAADLGALAVK